MNASAEDLLRVLELLEHLSAHHGDAAADEVCLHCAAINQEAYEMAERLKHEINEEVKP